MMQKNILSSSANYLSEFLPIFKNVFPVCAAIGLAALIGLVDVHLAGNLGAAVQAGVGIGDQALFFAALLGTGIAQACGSLIARARGAKESVQAAKFATAGLILATLLGAAASIIAFVFAEQFLTLFSNDAAVRNAGSLYLKLCSIANVPYCLLLTQSAILRASAKSFSTVFPWFIAATISIAFSISLPNLMPDGRVHTLEYIALAWNLGAYTAVSFGHAEMRRTGFDFFNQNFDMRSICLSMKQILALGLPIALTEAAWLGSNFFIYLILAQMPSANDAQAAWTIRLKIEELAATPLILATSMTAATQVGQLVGEGSIAKAAQTADKIAIFAATLMLVLGMLICFNSDVLAGNHATTQESAKLSQLLLSASILFYPLSAFYITAFGALEGAGSTLKPMFAVVCGLFLLRIPLAAFLALHMQMGMTGLLIAIVISHIAVALSAVSQLRSFFGYTLNMRQQELRI
jgi:Na+-driven multidrug efflux pump